MLRESSNTQESAKATTKTERVDLLDRLIRYSARLVSFCEKLEKAGLARVLSRQLLRSGTAIGANFHEAQGGQSKADFISKMSVAHKEALETLYWLRILERIELISQGEIATWLDETSQLIKILSSIILTSKQR